MNCAIPPILNIMEDFIMKKESKDIQVINTQYMSYSRNELSFYVNHYQTQDISKSMTKRYTENAYARLNFLFNNFKKICRDSHIKMPYKGKDYAFRGFDIANKLNSNQPTYDIKIMETVSSIDALTRFNTDIAEDYGPECIFISYEHQLMLDTKNDQTVASHNFNFQLHLESLAKYLYKKEFRNYAIMSKKQATSSEPYYYYDIENQSWSMTSEKVFKQNIEIMVEFILKQFTIKHLSASVDKVMKSIMRQIETYNDDHVNMLDNYTTKHPNYVQFGDLVYDMDTDKFAKMSRDFKLLQKHAYRIATGYDDVDKIDESHGWLDINITNEELRQKCHALIERFSIIHPKDDLSFIFSLIGHLFYHSGQKWQILPMIIGGGGLGKSHLYGHILASYMLGISNVSSITQNDIDSGSEFLKASFYQKELNLISETNEIGRASCRERVLRLV